MVKNQPVGAGEAGEAGEAGSIPVQEDPLEKEMATHSSILAWKIPWTEEPVGYIPWGHEESDMTRRMSTQAEHLKLGRVSVT